MCMDASPHLLNSTGTDDGRTGLSVAAAEGHLDVVSELIGRGAYLDAVAMDGTTVLHIAAEKGHIDVVEALIRAWANVDVQEEDGATALHIAAQSGRLGVVEALIRARANMDVQAEGGWTALYVAATKGNADVVEALLRAEPDMDAQTEDGATVLHAAADKGHLRVAEALIRARASIDVQSEGGSTALYGAARNGHLGVVEAFLHAGAIVESKSNYGTARDAAVRQDKRDVVAVIDEWTALTNDARAARISNARAALQQAWQCREDERCAVAAEQERREREAADARVATAAIECHNARLADTCRALCALRSPVDRTSLLPPEYVDIVELAHSTTSRADDCLLPSSSLVTALRECHQQWLQLQHAVLTNSSLSSSSSSPSSSSSSSSMDRLIDERDKSEEALVRAFDAFTFAMHRDDEKQHQQQQQPQYQRQPHDAVVYAMKMHLQRHSREHEYAVAVLPPPPSSSAEDAVMTVKRIEMSHMQRGQKRRKTNDGATRAVDAVDDDDDDDNDDGGGARTASTSKKMERRTNACASGGGDGGDMRRSKKKKAQNGAAEVVVIVGDDDDDDNDAVVGDCDEQVRTLAAVVCGVVGEWLSVAVEKRIGLQQQASRQSQALATMHKTVASFLDGGDITQPFDDSVGHNIHQCLERVHQSAVDADGVMAEHATTFPHAAFTAAVNALSAAVHRRLDIIKQVQRVLDAVRRDVADIRTGARVLLLQRVRDDYDVFEAAKKAARRATRNAYVALGDGEDDGVDGDALVALQRTLTQTKRAGNRVERAYRDNVIACLMSVRRLAPEALVVVDDGDDASHTLMLRQCHSSNGMARTDLTFESFDSPPTLISPAHARHVVYRAVLDGVVYALKLYLSDDTRVLMTEVQLLQRLKHPHVTEVSFVMIDTQRQLCYQAMPYYEGGSLQTRIVEGARVDAPMAKHVMRQLLLGLDHIHRNGVVHCDIKPDNIFLTAATPSQVKIGDFDVSKDNEQRATYVTTMMTNAVSGFTLEYVAPELMPPLSQRATYKSDMYSAGLVLFDMCVPRDSPAYALRPTAGNTTTMGDGAGVAGVVGDEQVAALLTSLLSADAQQRPSAHEALTHPYFTQGEVVLEQQARQRLGRLLVCAVCFESMYEGDGLSCPQGNDEHFLCTECATSKVTFDSRTGDDNALMTREGRVHCVGYSMKTNHEDVCAKAQRPQPYTDVALAQRLSSVEVFEAYMAARGEVLRALVERGNDTEVQQRVARELDEWKRLDERGRHVAEACRHITDNILTLKCPNPNGCALAFVDFEGCFAVSCSKCKTQFCAWCMKFCGADAHPHVRQCAYRLSADVYYGSMAEFEESNKRRRRAALLAYLPSLAGGDDDGGGDGLLGDVVAAMSVDLRDLGLDDVVVRFTPAE